jgi:hypothetical protein
MANQRSERRSRYGIALILFLNIAFALLVLYIFSKGGLAQTQALEYKDLISIVLTALAVMIATLTVFVAVAAIWGFTALREEARSAAENVAREAASETAKRVAKEVAESVAARTVLDAKPAETTPTEAAQIVGSLNATETPDGQR